MILIGSQRSDPWFSLFTAKTSFQFVTDPVTNGYYFHNANPLPGEQASYSVPDSHEKTREGYADIVLLQNSTQSGLNALLARKDLTYFEIFLSGKHIVGESKTPSRLSPFDPGSTRPGTESSTASGGGCCLCRPLG